MKVKMSKEINEKTLLSHIILDTMKTALAAQLAKEHTEKDGPVLDVRLTADGHELDLAAFVKIWEDQVERIVGEKAKELMDEIFSEVDDLMFDLQKRLKEEVNKRLEDWEEKIE